MKREELEELFKTHSDIHFLSGSVKNPRDLQAFIKLNELAPSDRDIVAAAEHDEFWLSTDLDDLAKVATEEDVIFLLNCGVRLDEDTDSLAFFA